VATRFPELQDAGWLRAKYEVEGLSSYAIAKQLGCRPTTVSRALQRFGIAARMGRPAAIQLGESYGRLTVLEERPGRVRGGRVYRCLCVCGSETDVQAAELKRGKVRSCGCLQAEYASRPRPPATVHGGERYGRLVVLHEVEREGTGSRLFACRCDCGKTTTVHGRNLRSAHTRSCGCLLHDYRRRGTTKQA
jgi:hypothetical protein